MNIDNAQKVVNILVDLAIAAHRSSNKGTHVVEINHRIEELAKSLKFSEEDLKSFLNEQST